jgi:hypothetical protein
VRRWGRHRVKVRTNSSKYQLESVGWQKAHIGRQDGICGGVLQFKREDNFDLLPRTTLLEPRKIESYLDLAFEGWVVTREVGFR